MKGLNFVLAGLGAAVLSVSLANNIYAAGGEPYASTGVMIDSATSSVYACYAISNADVASDNMSELESKGYYKISFTSGDGVISDQFDEIYCKDLGKAAELGELYENQFTYAGVYLDGSGERQDFSFYSLPLRVGKSQIPGFSKIDLLEYVKHEYEYGYIDDEENEFVNKMINEVVVDGSEYENTGSRASYRDLYGIAPNLQVTLVDLDKYVEVYKSYGVDLPPELGGLIAQVTKTEINHIEVPDNIFMAGVSVTQPIYTFGKIGNAVEGVRSAIKMSEAGREITRREVKYAAANVYWTAKMTDEIVKISKKDLNQAIAAKKSLTSAGRANRSNLVKVESDIATKEINLSDAEFNRDTAYRMLKILAGIDMNEELNLTDDFPKKFNDLKAGELKTTPEWEMLSEQVAMYERNARSKRAGAYPTLAATASYNYIAMDTEFENMFNRNNTQSAYWGVALQVPIFSGGLHRANATVEAMNAEAARQDLDNSKKMTTEEYNRAVEKYNHLRGNLKNLENARDLAAKAYDFSRDRFATGQTSAIELAEVSAGLYQLDMALINAKYNILMSAESVKKLGE